MRNFDENMTFATNNESEFLSEIGAYTENSKWDVAKIQSMRLSTTQVCNAFGVHESTEWSMQCDTLLSSSVVLPLSEMSIKSITERAGIRGSALSALATDDFIDVVNKCANVCNGNAKLFTVGGKLYAAHSDGYAVLEMDSIFN